MTIRLASSPMIRALLRSCALVTMTSTASPWILRDGFTQDEGNEEPARVLRAERIEIVDSKGRVCIELAGGPHGGSMTLLQPDMTVLGEGDAIGDRHILEGARPVIAYIGSPDGKDVRFELRYSGEHNSASIEMGVRGETPRPYIHGFYSKNLPDWQLGAGQDESGADESILRLYRYDPAKKQAEVYFAK